MKYLKLLAIAALISAFAISCSDDDDPTNPSNGSYFDVSAGDWWIYENHEVNEEGNIDESKYYDTTKVTATMNYTDRNSVTKEADVHTMTYSDGTDSDEVYFANTETQLWTTTDFILPSDMDFNLPIDELVNAWVMLIDDKSNSWTVFPEITVTQDDIEITDGVEGDLSAKFKIDGKKSNKVSWNGLGKTYQAQEFLITNSIVLTLTPDAMPIPITINLNIEIKMWYVEGIGLVRAYVPPQEVTLLTQTFPIDGSDRVLIDTNKK